MNAVTLYQVLRNIYEVRSSLYIFRAHGGFEIVKLIGVDIGTTVHFRQ